MGERPTWELTLRTPECFKESVLIGHTGRFRISRCWFSIVGENLIVLRTVFPIPNSLKQVPRLVRVETLIGAIDPYTNKPLIAVVVLGNLLLQVYLVSLWFSRIEYVTNHFMWVWVLGFCKYVEHEYPEFCISELLAGGGAKCSLFFFGPKCLPRICEGISYFQELNDMHITTSPPALGDRKTLSVVT